VRGAPLKTFGILAAEIVSFNTQCDCFVTKRLANARFALKEVTNQSRRWEAFRTLFMGWMGQTSDQQSVNLEEGGPRGFRKCVTNVREKNL